LQSLQTHPEKLSELPPKCKENVPEILQVYQLSTGS
jgi:hypothetical protein